jgi:hypothetical protein
LNLARWFRRHRRYLLAGLVVMLMVAWGVLGTVQGLLRRGMGDLGMIRGEPVTEPDMREAHLSLKVAVALGLLDPQALGALRYGNPTPRAVALLLVLQRDFSEFVFGEEPALDTAALWRFMVLSREADAAGVEATQAEAGELLGLSPVLLGRTGFSQDAFRSFLSVYGYTESQVTGAVFRLTRVAKLILLRREAVAASRPELWAAYAHGAESVKVRYVAVDAAWFEPLVEVQAEQLRSFYEERRAQRPDPAAGTAGYLAPERARVECALVPLEQYAKELSLSDEEVAAYYEANRDEFLEREPQDEAELEEEQEQVQEDEQEQEHEQEQEKEQEQEEGGPPEGYRYRALEEVADEIRDRLGRQRARQKGEELLAAMQDELAELSVRYANQPLPLAQMARRHGLTYKLPRTEEGRELLSREELAEALPYGEQVAAFAFEEDSLYYPRPFSSGHELVICQVLERRDAEPQPFDEVRGQVRRDYAARQALERAQTFAGKLKESADQLGLDAAAERMEGRLADLLGGREAEGEPRLEAKESGLFSRQRREVPGMGGAGGAVVEAAFKASDDETALAVEPPPVARCYVMRVAERRDASAEEFARRAEFFGMIYETGKQSRVVQEWLEGLVKAARLVRPVGE